MTSTATLAPPVECVHDMDPSWCSLCRTAAGYRTADGARRNDCTVRSFVELTGADYDEAVTIMVDHGYRAGRGFSMDGFVAALASVGFTATETTRIPPTGAVVVAAWLNNGKGHAFTVIDGKINRGGRDGRWVRARRQRAWVVS